MSNASATRPGDERTEGESQKPAKTSLRGRILNRMARLVVKRWPRGDYKNLVRHARRWLDIPVWMIFPVAYEVSFERVQDTNISGEWVIPDAMFYDDKVLLYLHGGGYVSCSPQSHRSITAALARLLHQRVFALDYRLAPEAPFPAAVDDAAHAFARLMELGLKAQNIAIAGDSSGGGLVIATMLRLHALRQPMPACGVCLSPWVDLTGESSYGNSERCAMFRQEDIGAFAALYLNGASPRLPEASPIFADLKGLPPLLIQTSTTELLFDEALRLHERATRSGVESTLRPYAGLPHVWQIFAPLIPEADAALREIAAFVQAQTAAANAGRGSQIFL